MEIVVQVITISESRTHIYYKMYKTQSAPPFNNQITPYYDHRDQEKSLSQINFPMQHNMC